MAAYQDRTWIINRNGAYKDDGASFWKWNIEAPTDAPVATASTQESKTIAAFQASEAWVVTDADGAAVASSYDSAVSQDGSALTFTAPSSGTFTAEATLGTLDTSIGGAYREDDKFLMWARFSDPALVSSFTVAIDVDTGDFAQNYYKANVAMSQFSDVANAWTQLELRRGLSGASILQSNPDIIEIQREAQADTRSRVQRGQKPEELSAAEPASRTRLSRGAHQQVLDDMRGNALANTPLFDRVGRDETKNWGNAKTIRIQVRATEGTVVHLDLAQFVGGPASSLEGAYTWYVTFDNVYGDESNPSPVSNELAVDKTGVLVTLPISGDPQTSRRHLYRVGEELDVPHRVLTVNDNASTSVLDTVSNEDAQNLNITLDVDHDAPPLARGLVGPYFGKLIAFGTEEHRNRLFWTKTARPSFFPGASDPGIGQWFDVGDDKEWIYAATLHDRSMWIYKERSIHRVDGDPDLSDPTLKAFGFGTVGPNCVANAGVIDYFVSADGIYSFDGEQPRKISVAVDGIFKRDHVDIGPTTHQPVNREYLHESVLGFADGLLYFSYVPEGASTPTRTLIYNPDTGQWGHHILAVGDGGFTDIYWQGKGTKTLVAVGTETSTVYELEGNFTDNGTALTLIWISAAMDAGLPENDKVWEDVVIDIKTAKGDQPPSTLTIQAYFDNLENAVTLGTVSSSERKQFTLQIDSNAGGRTSKNMAIRIAGTSDAEVTVYSVMAHYYVEARSARSFDSDEIDLGTEKVKQVSEIQIDVTNPQPIGAKLSTDLPGNAVAVRKTWTSPASSGRRPYRLVMEPYAEGRVLRFRSYSIAPTDQKFKMHGVRARVRTIGTYVETYESGQGFVWDSTVVNLGEERVKEAKTLILHIDTDGPIRGDLITDFPGNALAVRRTVNIEDTSTERFIRFPLPDIQGRLWQLKLYGTSGYRLYEAAVEARVIGTFVEQYEGQAGATWDSKELDFGTHGVKEAFEIEFDVNAGGAITAEVYSDLPGNAMTLKTTITIPQSTTRRKVTRSLDYIEGRLFRVVIKGPQEFTLYDVRLRVREFGVYVDADQGANGARWDSTELDFGINEVKEIQELEFFLDTDGAMTLTAESDLPGNHRTLRLTKSINTGITTPKERKFMVPFASEVLGRFFRFKLAGTSAFRLFGVRAKLRPIGTFIEAYEMADGAIYDSQEQDFGTAQVKEYEILRLHCETEGPVTATIYTDLGGEAMTSREVEIVNTQVTTTGERIMEVELPWRTEGRLVRVTLSGAREIRLYKASMGFQVIPVYLSAGQTFRTTDYDFGDERVKLIKEVEVVCDTDGPATFRVYTELPNQSMVLARQEMFNSEDTTTGRRTFKLRMPGNVSGRLIRAEVEAGSSPCRILSARARIRVVGEASNWTWVDFPMAQGSLVRQWIDLPVKPTPALAEWVDLPIKQTAHIYEWVNLPVVPTTADYHTIEFPVEKSSNFEWIDIPVDAVE